MLMLGRLRRPLARTSSRFLGAKSDPHHDDHHHVVEKDYEKEHQLDGGFENLDHLVAYWQDSGQLDDLLKEEVKLIDMKVITRRNTPVVFKAKVGETLFDAIKRIHLQRTDKTKADTSCEDYELLRDKTPIEDIAPAWDGSCQGRGGVANESVFNLGPHCTQCHVYVQNEYMERLGKVHAWEEIQFDQMDSELFHPRNSRLACQIRLTEEMDGMTVALPQKQIDLEDRDSY